VAHELGHDYVWDEFEEASTLRDNRRLQELELRCDGIAVIALQRLASLVSLAWSIGDYNQALSAVVFADTIAVVCFLIAAALHVVARRRS
jgi:hypothetical protein